MSKNMKLSIILPTYNNEKTIRSCLNSIFMQNFPRNQFEVLFIDGGSTDKTLEIARKFPVKLINNPKRNEEAARILGLSKARGEIIALVDADNVLVGKDWLSKMLKPFEDLEIQFADTLYFSYRDNDPMKVRYQALIGGDDPLAAYLGFYSRWCYFKNNWTDFPYKSEQKKGYIKVSLSNKKLVPAMGSNGFLIRKSILRKFVKDTFIHSDIVYELVNKGHNCFAKVDTGIIHDQPAFFKNKIRRIQRRERNEVKIRYNYGMTNLNIAKVFLRSIIILPVIYDVIKGFLRKPNSAWLYHFPALYGLIAIHAHSKIVHFLRFK